MPKIIGNGAPTSSTPGTLGQEYFDKDSNTVYTCIKAEHKTEGYGFEGEYEWAVIGGSSEPDLVIELDGAKQLSAATNLSFNILAGTAKDIADKLARGIMPKIVLHHPYVYSAYVYNATANAISAYHMGPCTILHFIISGSGSAEARLLEISLVTDGPNDTYPKGIDSLSVTELS